MATLLYETNSTEDAVLGLLASQGSQTVNAYFLDLVRATLENIRLETLIQLKEHMFREVDRSLNSNEALSITKDINTGFPVVERV